MPERLIKHHAGHANHPREVRGLVSGWWEQRRELRAATAWEVPFPPLPGQIARVTCEQGVDGFNLWRGALLREHALSAYIEVESREGPIAVLENLYDHTV